MELATRCLNGLVLNGVSVPEAVLVDLLATAGEALDAPLCARILALLAPSAQVDEGTLCAVLNTGGRLRNAALVQVAWARLEAQAARGRQLTPATWAAKLAACARCGDLEGAFRTLVHLPGAPATTMEPLVAACNELDESYFTLERMHAAGESVTVEAVNAVVYACVRAVDVGRAFETFDSMEALGVSANLTTFNALLEACLWQATGSAQVEAEMAARKIAGDSTTASLVVDNLLRERQLPQALERAETAGGMHPSTLGRLLRYATMYGDASQVARVRALGAIDDPASQERPPWWRMMEPARETV